MPLTPILDTHTVAQLVGLLNGNFEYLAANSGGAKHVATLSGVTGAQTVTHNLASQEITVSIWDGSGNLVLAPVQITSDNAITVTFDVVFSGRVIVRS